MYALIDCNNFYVSCERHRDKTLEGRPVVVVSGGGGGCVIARSQEAKALGIQMGDPEFQIRHTIRRHNVAAIPTDFQLYSDKSHEVMNLLTDFSPEVEVYSVDEAFVNLRGLQRFGSADYAQEIRARVKSEAGIPVSIGLAPTKTLSKLASHIAKKTLASDGCHAFTSKRDVTNAADWMEIGEVWGIGRRYQKFLRSHGIRTVSEFMDLPADWVKKHMTVVGWRTHQELHGNPVIPITIGRKARKSIQTARTFPQMQTELSVLTEILSAFAAQCAFEMRHENGVARELFVFMQTNPHRPDLRQCSRSAGVKFDIPTDSTIELVSAVRQAAEECFWAGYQYKRAGVVLNKIEPSGLIQYSLFDDAETRAKHQALMKTVDGINQRQGKKVFIAAQGDTRLGSFYNTFRPDPVQEKET